jgi:hypothetical protein
MHYESDMLAVIETKPTVLSAPLPNPHKPVFAPGAESRACLPVRPAAVVGVFTDVFPRCYTEDYVYVGKSHARVRACYVL